MYIDSIVRYRSRNLLAKARVYLLTAFAYIQGKVRNIRTKSKYTARRAKYTIFLDNELNFYASYKHFIW
jgi:hypothetical protein